MEWFNINESLKLWGQVYYTMPLMYLLSLITIIYAITIRPKTNWVMVIVWFSCASLIQSVIDIITPKNFQFISSLGISAFIIIEITCCYWLVTLSHVTVLQKRVMQLLLIAFYIFEAIYIMPIFLKMRLNANESLIELPMLIVFVSIYYNNLLIKAPQQNLFRQPLFWAISGMALIAIVQIPCNIVMGYFEVYSKSYTRLFIVITSLSYSFLFICFLKAVHLYKQHGTAKI